MVRGEVQVDKGSEWGHRSQIEQGGAHSQESCVFLGGVGELVIWSPRWLAAPAVLADMQVRGAMQESGVPLGLGQTISKCGPCQSLPAGLRDQFTGKPGFPGRNCSQRRPWVQSRKSFGGLGRCSRKPIEGVLNCGRVKPVTEGLGQEYSPQFQANGGRKEAESQTMGSWYQEERWNSMPQSSAQPLNEQLPSGAFGDWIWRMGDYGAACLTEVRWERAKGAQSTFLAHTLDRIKFWVLHKSLSLGESIGRMWSVGTFGISYSLHHGEEKVVPTGHGP